MVEARAEKPAGPLSLFGLAIAGGVVVIDQASKLLAEARLPLGEAIDLLPVLALYRVHNTGIAFSLLSAAGGLPLILLTLAISVAVLVFWVRASEGGWMAATGFALILGGAIGNLIDRVTYGHVIDFLLLHIGEWTLFVFNLADAALTFGPILLLFTYAWPGRATGR